jgi:Tfp pilus assembly protein PilF
MRRWITAALILLLAFCTAGVAEGADPAGQADYLAGLDALQNKQWQTAQAAFAKALEADDDNATYHLARGIAEAVAGDVNAARADFNRSQRLSNSDAITSQWSNLMIANQRPQLEAAAQQFVDSEMSSHPEFARAAIARGGNAAPHDLNLLLQNNPWDMDALLAHARLVRTQGNLLEARAELTRVLTAKTNFGNGYAERAPIEAALGNLQRARADLNLARQYGAETQAIASAETELARFKDDPAANSPQQLWAAIEQSAQAGATWDQLVPQASALEKSMNARRLRWDELYQDKLRALEDAVRDKPKDISALLALGEFLYRESDVLAEPVAPKGWLRYYRFAGAGAPDREIAYADRVFDEVLQIDPRNVDALTWKAAIRLEHDQWPEGEALVKQALSIRQDVPQLLELFSRVLDNSAAAKAYTAQDLRTPRTWMTWGINVDVMWTHTPTQDELDRADNLTDAANQLWAASEQSLTAAVAAEAGTADGAYYSGLLQARHGDTAAALASYQQAVKLDPTSKRNRQALARMYNQLGQTVDAVAEEQTLILQRETTARFQLAAAWNDAERTAFKGAHQSLDQAVAIDPADSRIAAYLAAVASAEQKPELAVQQYAVATAMEQAHLMFKGRSLAPDATGALEPDDVGMVELMNLRAASRWGALRQADKALSAVTWNIAISGRVPREKWMIAPGRAVLPNIADPKAINPRTLENLFAWSNVLAGHLMLDAGKTADAEKLFDEVAGWKRTRNIYEPQGIATAGSLRLHWATQDPVTTRRADWFRNAHAMSVLTQQEASAILAIEQSQTQLARTGYADQRETMRMSQEAVDLYYFMDAQKAAPGAYDPRNNPNYRGNNDNGPDDRGSSNPAGSGAGAAPQGGAPDAAQ